jgi:hypothetical protein
MRGTGKRITITFPPDRPDDFYTRVWWFGEALHSPIVHDGRRTLCDVDRARDVLWFDLADSHELGKAKKIVRRELARFELTADAVVSIE